MTATKFLELAKVCEKLTKTTKITEKTQIVSNFLKDIKEDEISPAILLIIGSIFSETDPRTLDINWKSLESVLRAKKQLTLFREPLTITSVYKLFSKVAEISGIGSKRKKKDILITMFGQASSLERKYLIRNIFSEMRHGVKEGVMLKAISEASDIEYPIIKRGYMINGDIGEIGRIAILKGIEGFQDIKIKLFQPIKPMLGEILDDLSEIFVKNGVKFALEYKYDGIRVQIHKKEQKIKIFTRHLKEITSSFPEIIELISENIKTNKIIVEGELIAVGNDGKPLPFQELMQRTKRIYKIDTLQIIIPVKLLLFDIIYCEDASFLNKSYHDRWKILAKIVNKIDLPTKIITDDINEAKEFYNDAINAGHEGIMVKTLESIYYPGERKKYWLKLKSEIRLDLVIIAADWGTGRRHNWLSNYHLAVLDNNEEFQVIGKTFKGLTDIEFEQITEELLRLKVKENEFTIFVRPKIIVEVAFNEIQKSKQYSSGYALRFARIKRIRIDKDIDEATKLDEITYLYKKQFEKKSKL